MIIRPANTNDYPRIMEIWKSSVQATHDFLKDEDFKLFQELIPTEFLPQLKVFVIEEETFIPAYFAVSDDNLEMLFVHSDYRGKSYGKTAINHIIQQLKIYKVDVNEQNKQAVDFYLKMNYQLIGRSEKDGMGKDYPLLHLKYSK